MRRLSGLGLVLTTSVILVATVPVGAGAQAPCATGGLTSYLAPGFSCTIGALTFSDFVLNGTNAQHNKEVSPGDLVAFTNLPILDGLQLTPIAPGFGQAGFVLTFPDNLVTTPGNGGGIDDGDFDSTIDYADFFFHVSAGAGFITGLGEFGAGTLTPLGVNPLNPTLAAGWWGDFEDASGLAHDDFGYHGYVDYSYVRPLDAPLQEDDLYTFGSAFITSGGTQFGSFAATTESLISYTEPATVTPEPPVLLLLGPAVIILASVRKRTARRATTIS